MAIHINEQDQLFHLQTDHTSYVFQVMENGELGQLYYGKRMHVRSAYSNLATRDNMMPHLLGNLISLIFNQSY